MTARLWACLLSAALIVPSTAAPPTSMPSADAVLALLRDGNERFAAGHAAHPHADAERRIQTYRDGQHPIAAIVSCSDSRVPVELIFDEGIGDLFVIRVAGNVCATHETGSLEYAIEHLKIPLLIVMGHADCGAITAVARGDIEHGRVLDVVEHIQPAVDKARREHPELRGAALVAAAVRENVWHTIADFLADSAFARDAIRAGRLRVVGAVYDLATGRIEWLGTLPDQSRLLASYEPADRADDRLHRPTTKPAAP